METLTNEIGRVIMRFDRKTDVVKEIHHFLDISEIGGLVHIPMN